jgi:hypothetical protein
MKHEKLTPQEQEQLAAAMREQGAQQTSIEFTSVEDMLRHDALHTPVPPAVAARLAQSIGPLPPPARSWWRRLFGRSG